MKHYKLLTLLISLAVLLSTPVFAADKVYNTQLVIVGAGLSGSTAAAAAVEEGIDTIVLEKQPMTGGMGAVCCYSTGAYGSRIQQQHNQLYSPEAAFDFIMNFTHYKGNASVLRKSYENSSDTIDWLVEHGARFTSMNPQPETRDTNHNGSLVFEGGHPTAVLTSMINEFKAKGGTLLVETTAKHLIIKDGKVAGVVAENADGDKITVNAKAVILATGGFADNKEMLKQYVGTDKIAFFPPPSNRRMGDGVRMAQEAGAILGSMSTLGQMVAFDFTFPVRNVYVNQLGKRFVNEEAGIMAYPALDQWIGHAWSIIDQNDIDDVVSGRGVNATRVFIKSNTMAVFFYPELGMDGPGAIDASDNLTGYGYPDNHDKTLQARLDKAVAEGRVVKADSVEELARKLNMPAAALQETFKQTTLGYEVKHDLEMDKDPIYLRSIGKAPFYASRYSSQFAWGTLGGARIDEYGRAINQDFQPISGLYMAGTDIGGLYDGAYPYTNEGTVSCVSFNMARVSVKHIKQTLGK